MGRRLAKIAFETSPMDLAIAMQILRQFGVGDEHFAEALVECKQMNPKTILEMEVAA